jgi:hypothetical protein
MHAFTLRPKEPDPPSSNTRPWQLAAQLLRLGFTTLVLSAAAALTAQNASAADYAYRTNGAGDVVLTLSGRITSVDGAIFLKEVQKHGPRIVEIEGLGGDMLSAVRIGVIIHERHMWTHAIGTCRSACAYIWIAGLHMLATEGVEIANHLPVAIDGAEAGMPHDRGIAIFGWYLGKLNISVDMMDAFLNQSTQYGTRPNQYFDMLAFARYWNAPVEIVPDLPKTELARLEEVPAYAEAPYHQ